MDYEMEGVRPRGRPKKSGKRSCKKVVRPDKYATKMLWTVVSINHVNNNK